MRVFYLIIFVVVVRVTFCFFACPPQNADFRAFKNCDRITWYLSCHSITETTENRYLGYKTFFMLNSHETEI